MARRGPLGRPRFQPCVYKVQMNLNAENTSASGRNQGSKFLECVLQFEVGHTTYASSQSTPATTLTFTLLSLTPSHSHSRRNLTRNGLGVAPPRQEQGRCARTNLSRAALTRSSLPPGNSAQGPHHPFRRPRRASRIPGSQKKIV